MTFARQREPEWMDDPNLDEDLHRHALAGLQRINAWSRSGTAIWKAIEPLIRSNSQAELRVLDLATGGGDVALSVASAARRRGLKIQVTGCDFSPVAIAEARRRAKRQGERSVDFFELNVLEEDLPRGYDVVMCSLFLHHLEEAQVVELLRRMGQAAGSFVLIDDLCRSRLGYWLAWFGCRLLTRSPVVHKDGPLSVSGAFTPEEVMRMAEQAGLQNASWTLHWPQRFLFRWSRS